MVVRGVVGGFIMMYLDSDWEHQVLVEGVLSDGGFFQSSVFSGISLSS
jgi:hypothetical protein